ncbi:MAG: HEAT repeat domain-containing protein [Candidatus Acidiferrales bacterium]
MHMRRMHLRLLKLLDFALVLGFFIPRVSFAWRCAINPQIARPSESIIGQRISFLIQQTIQRSTITLKNGSSATVMPVNPSDADLREVKSYGDAAVTVLAGYVTSTSAMEQHVAFRFLAELQGDLAFKTIEALAEKSSFAGVRQEATVDLAHFPEEKARPILVRISSNDPDSDVRAAAERTLKHYRAAQRQQN